MSTEEMKPLLFALADAIETDLSTTGTAFTGSRKAVLELFEGYSPTVISSIERSLWDGLNKVVAADQHIFGNVGVVTVVEGQQSTVHCFVYDRSKRPENSNCLPWPNSGCQWSRKDLYFWLEDSCKAIYHRDLWSEEWKKLEGASAKLKLYNYDRDDGVGAKKAYNRLWEGS